MSLPPATASLQMSTQEPVFPQILLFNCTDIYNEILKYITCVSDLMKLRVNHKFRTVVYDLIKKRYCLDKFNLTPAQLCGVIRIREEKRRELNILYARGFGLKRTLIASCTGPTIIVTDIIDKYIQEAIKCNTYHTNSEKSTVVNVTKGKRKYIENLSVKDINSKIFIIQEHKKNPSLSLSRKKITRLLSNSKQWTIIIHSDNDVIISPFLTKLTSKIIRVRFEKTKARYLKIKSHACYQLNPTPIWKLEAPSISWEKDDWKATVERLINDSSYSRIVITGSKSFSPECISELCPKAKVVTTYQDFEPLYKKKKKILKLSTTGIQCCDADIVIAIINDKWQLEEITNLEYIYMPNRKSFNLYIICSDNLVAYSTIAHARASRFWYISSLSAYDKELTPSQCKKLLKKNQNCDTEKLCLQASIKGNV